MVDESGPMGDGRLYTPDADGDLEPVGKNYDGEVVPLADLPPKTGSDNDGTTPQDPGGAPIGNTNALKHGGRTKARVFPIPSIEKRYPGVYHGCLRFRRHLERVMAEAESKKDEAELAGDYQQPVPVDKLSLKTQALINRATRWDMVARMTDHQLRVGAKAELKEDEADEPKREIRGQITDPVALCREGAKASVLRDKCLEALGLFGALEAGSGSEWDSPAVSQYEPRGDA